MEGTREGETQQGLIREEEEEEEEDEEVKEEEEVEEDGWERRAAANITVALLSLFLDFHFYSCLSAPCLSFILFYTVFHNARRLWIYKSRVH